MIGNISFLWSESKLNEYLEFDVPYKDHNSIIDTIFFIIAIYDIVQNVKKSCFDLLHTSFTIQWEDIQYTVILTNGYHYCVKYAYIR